MAPASSSPPPHMPRWVKIFALVGGVLVVTFLIVHLAGGGFGNHLPAGPGR